MTQTEETATTETRSFNPNEHLMQLKSKDGMKDYLPVQWRLVWFREQCPQGQIETTMLHFDPDAECEEEGFAWNAEKRTSEKVVKHAKGYAVFHATVTDGKGGCASGTKMEKAVSFGDYLEKAETGAIGRALVGLGYGTQFAPELDEDTRIVDAPVTQQQRTTATAQNGNGAKAQQQAQQATTRPTNAAWVVQIKGEIKPIMTEYFTLDEQQLPADWWQSVLQKCFSRVPDTFTAEQVKVLADYRDRLAESVTEKRTKAAARKF